MSVVYHDFLSGCTRTLVNSPVGSTIFRFWRDDRHRGREKSKSLFSRTMLPLLTLTKDGARYEVVEEMITGLHAAGKSDLLLLGFAFAGLVFDKPDDQDWLKRRLAMLKDVLEESWVYQEMKQQGLAEGLEKGKREALGRTLMSFVQKRFPDVVPLAEKHIAVTKNPEVLQHIIDELFAVQTTEEARHVLSVSLKRKKKTASK